MIVDEKPSPDWLGHRFRCEVCTAWLRFELHDMRDKAFKLRRGLDGRWTGHVRCALCGSSRAPVTQEVEMREAIDDNPVNPTLELCVLCGHAYPTAAMWPRPDGYVCDECSMKVIDDGQ